MTTCSAACTASDAAARLSGTPPFSNASCDRGRDVSSAMLMVSTAWPALAGAFGIGLRGGKKNPQGGCTEPRGIAIGRTVDHENLRGMAVFFPVRMDPLRCLYRFCS